MLGGSSKVQWDTLPFQPPKPTDDIFVEGGDEAQDPGVLKGFSGKKIHEIPSCFSEFCKLTSCELQKNMEEELPETDPENVNPVAWLKQFDIKEIVTSEPSRDSLDGNRWGFAISYGNYVPRSFHMDPHLQPSALRQQ